MTDGQTDERTDEHAAYSQVALQYSRVRQQKRKISDPGCATSRIWGKETPEGIVITFLLLVVWLVSATRISVQNFVTVDEGF